MSRHGILVAFLAFSAALTAPGQLSGATPVYIPTVIPSPIQGPPNPHIFVRALDVNSHGQAVIADCQALFDGAGCTIYLWSATTGLVPTGLFYTLGECQSNISLVPVRINERGEIGGNFCGDVFLWSAKTLKTTLATLNPFSIYDQVAAFTDRGEIAGTTYVGPYYAAYYASAQTGAVIPPFTLSSVALDMNNNGEMIGSSGPPFYWSLSAGVIPIDVGSSTSIRSIADDGTVLGVSQPASGGESLFLWDRHHGVTAAAPLGAPGASCDPYRATSSGLVVGRCFLPNNTQMQMWTWTTKAGYTYYAPIPVFSITDMNESGQVVGTSYMAYPLTHAYVWSSEAGLIDLDPGHSDRASSALAIASDGTISGAIGPNAAVWTVGAGDSTPPVITPQISGTPGNNGWYRSAVTVNWSVTDPESGIASSTGCAPTNLTADTAGVTLTCSATNGVGLSTSVPITIKIDMTPPVISGMPAAGCSLWPPNHKLVHVATVTAADALSGLVPGSLKVTGASNEPSSNPKDPEIVITPNGSGGFIVQLQADRSGGGNGRVYTLNATAMDNAGNSVTATATCSVPHDKGSH
jgi:probable HAF family extracellular repeat protein